MWAEAVIRQASRPRDPDTAAEALALVETTNHNSAVCMKTLVALYRGDTTIAAPC